MTLSLVLFLLLAGIALICAEFFVPGGILGLLGCISLLTGIGCAFTFGTNVGMITVVSASVVTFIAVKLVLKYLPKTKLGKAMIIQEDLGHSGGVTVDVSIGEIGTAHTKLRPSGTVIIREMRVDVITEGNMIDQGSEVKVIKIQGNRVTVTQVADSNFNNSPLPL